MVFEDQYGVINFDKKQLSLTINFGMDMGFKKKYQDVRTHYATIEIYTRKSYCYYFCLRFIDVKYFTHSKSLGFKFSHFNNVIIII